jgi:Uma2 family endonuclease
VLEHHPPTVRGPDLAILRTSRFPSPDHPGFVEGAPDLAIEVVSPSNTPSRIRERIADFFRAGARFLWIIDPATRTVAVHHAGAATRLYHPGDELDGGDLLPGLRLPVASIFRA